MEFKYTWIHLKSRVEGYTLQDFNSRLEFLEALNKWNRLGAGSWQYFESTS